MTERIDLDSEELVERLINDREAFNAFVYTPLNEAVSEIKIRRNDPELLSWPRKIIGQDVPLQLSKTIKGAMVRNIATPNHETIRFLQLIESLDDIDPILIECVDDKFVPLNKLKQYLGKLRFFMGRNKHGELISHPINIIEFNKSMGKKFSNVVTAWGQPLVDLHHEMLWEISGAQQQYIYDISSWCFSYGPSAKEFYKPLLSLFIKHAILFENFLLEDLEGEQPFIKEVFLPAFIEVSVIANRKPLIVALEPTEIESDTFWLCYPEKLKGFVEKKF